MKYEDILDIVKLKFNNFFVIEKKYNSYGLDVNRIIIKRFNDRLDCNFKFAEIYKIEENWVISYSVGDKEYPFILEPNNEIDLLEISIDWYNVAFDIQEQKNSHFERYQSIKRNKLIEIRNHRLNKLL